MSSRIARKPISVPNGVDVSIKGKTVTVKGKNGQLSWDVPQQVGIEHNDNIIKLSMNDASKQAKALSGTSRALINNMVLGVSQGFEKKLTLVGVGYRVQIKGKQLVLLLGFSHPINFDLPEGVQAVAPTQTELTISGADKQLVGQVAAKIRAFRPPEPYKGKGVRYTDEKIVIKEIKK